MGNTRNTEKARRHADLYKDYLAELKELGDHAAFMSRRYIYEKLAVKYYYSTDTVEIIIQKEIKKSRKCSSMK